MTGISVGSALKADFLGVQSDTAVFGFHVEITNNDFAKKAVLQSQGDFKSDFGQIQEAVHVRDPSYWIVRSPRVTGKWVCIFYCPSSAPVRSRMVYAGSVNSLKSGLGSDSFSNDYHATVASECSLQEYLSSFGEYDASELMTYQEREREEAEFESQMTASQGPTKTSVDIPVNIGDNVMAALQGVAGGSLTTGIFKINTKSETILLVHSGNESIEGLLAHMPDRDGRYIVQSHSYEHDDSKMTQNLFFFFCPENAKPRHKMIYATVKSKMIALCREAGITGMKTMEMSDTAEMTEKNIYLDLHPPVVQKVAVKKPKPKRSKGRKTAKFQART